MNSSKNILITGGSGYVGSRLCSRLIRKDNLNIVNYDISLFGDDHLPKNKQYAYVKGDLRNTKLLNEYSY